MRNIGDLPVRDMVRGFACLNIDKDIVASWMDKGNKVISYLFHLAHQHGKKTKIPCESRDEFYMWLRDRNEEN
eukprot:11651262-Prorocentrum_lima.AAC.1